MLLIYENYIGVIKKTLFPKDFPVQCCSLISLYLSKALHLKGKPHVGRSLQ